MTDCLFDVAFATTRMSPQYFCNGKFNSLQTNKRVAAQRGFTYNNVTERQAVYDVGRYPFNIITEEIYSSE